MRHGSLFSGIGGFDLAAQWMGWDNVFQVEKDEYCQKVLTKNFPNVTRYGDIKEFNGAKYRGAVDIISGGFPCQPFSQVGKRKGTKDTRHLWPEMLRVIQEIKPTWIVAENVHGILTIDKGMVFESVCVEMENSGYEVQPFIIPACGVSAPHRRKRIWIIGKSQLSNSDSIFSRYGFNAACNAFRAKETANESCRESLPNKNNWNAEPAVGRMAHGIPNRVDRIKGLGNSIVPQIAFEIFKAIDLIAS